MDEYQAVYDEYQHPLFFEAKQLNEKDKQRIRRYFQKRRDSGGGDCGMIEKAGYNTYKICFKEKEDQESVLQRKLHTISLTSGELHLTVSQTNSPQTPEPINQSSTKHLQTFKNESTKGLEKILKMDIFLLYYLRDNPKAFRVLKKQLSAIGCKVWLDFDGKEAVVRGDIEKGPERDFDSVAERWEQQVNTVFISLNKSYLCYHVNEPTQVKTLLQDVSFVSDDVNVYTEGSDAVIVGEVHAVKERIEILEKRSLTRKGLQVVEKQFKLVEDEFSLEMCAHHPKVKILRGVNLIVLEGPDEEVQLAETKLEELIKQLKEKRVKLSAALITFMTSSGVISKYQTRFQQSLRSPVALEVGLDLVLSSLSFAALDEAETAVLRDLSEVTVQLQGSTASSPHLDKVKEILIKAKNEANLQELRVEVSFVPDPRAAVIKVQLVGYTEHVNKLKDLLQEYQTFKNESTKGLEKILKMDIFLLYYLRDNPKTFKVLEKQLSAIGCKVELNFDGKEAVVRGDIEKGSERDFDSAAERWEQQVNNVSIRLNKSYLCYHVNEPKQVKTLLQDVSFVSDDVKVYTEGSDAVIVGEVHAVKERIEILEKRSLTRKGLQVVEKQFKLIEDEFSLEMYAHHPKVKILRGVNLIVLEGPDEEVQLAETTLEVLIKQLKEKRVKLSAALITFMTSSGVISKYQTRFQRSLRSPVGLEVGSDLVLSSLSSAALDEAETAVLRDLSEVTVQLQGSTASPPHLDKVKEILIKAKNEANLQELRVEVSFVPDPRAAVIKVHLVGYTEHVNKLKDLLLEYQTFKNENTKGVQKILKMDIFLLYYLRDNPKTFKVLEKQLSAIGCKVELNFDGKEAVVRGDIEKGSEGDFDSASERWEQQVNNVFISLNKSYLCYHVNEPKQVKTLLQDVSFVNDDVKVYTEGSDAVIVGEVHAVKERIEILEKRPLTHKGLQVVKKQFKLVEDEFRREMCAHHPKVKILRGINLIVLEGPDKEVQLRVTKLEELIKQLKEKRVKLSAALITFMTSSGVISKYQTRFQQSLRNPVALEVGSDLVLSSLSSAALDEAETAVLRDLSEVTVQLQGSTASPHLDKVKEILIKAKNEANLQELRVEVSFVPDPRAAVIKVQLVGYTEHVNKLKDLLLEYQIEHWKNFHPQQADEVQKNISDKNRQAGGPGGNRTTQDSWDSVMKKKKISIVVLGTADHLKKNLMSLIMGKDVFAQRIGDVNIEKHDNDTYEVTFTPNLYRESEDIRKLLSSKQHDMCLLVVEDGFTTQEVQQQIEHLHKITKKPTEDFIVVLPLGYKHEESYLFKFCTLDDLFNKLRKPTQHRTLMPTNKRSADQSHTQKRMTDGSYRQDHFTGHKKSLKERKFSIVVLGTEDHLKKSLISVILGKDVFAQRISDVKIEKHESDTHEVTFTPNLYKASDDIRRLFSSQQHPDMCLLVVEDGFKIQEVWYQVEHLHKITGKPSEEFTVVLPLRYKHEEYYPFRFYTWDDLFNKLRKLTEDRNHKPSNKRSDEQPHPPMETDKPLSLLTTFGRSLTVSSTDNKKRSKGNHTDNKVNLVLLGMSGTGKSATGNTILGHRRFESKVSYMPITTECEAAETEINGIRVCVIDTPDMFNDDIKSSVKNQHVTQCKQLCQSDPCVYLLVIHVSRFTDGERDILTKVEEAFGRGAKEQTIILFTRGEELQHDKMSLKGYIHSCQPELKKIIEQCDRRCVVFENQTSRQHQQVAALMQTVFRMLDKQQKQ